MEARQQRTIILHWGTDAVRGDRLFVAAGDLIRDALIRHDVGQRELTVWDVFEGEEAVPMDGDDSLCPCCVSGRSSFGNYLNGAMKIAVSEHAGLLVHILALRA